MSLLVAGCPGQLLPREHSSGQPYLRPAPCVSRGKESFSPASDGWERFVYPTVMN